MKIYSQVKSLSDLGIKAEILLICENNSQIIPDKSIKPVIVSPNGPGPKILNIIRREHSINTILLKTIQGLKNTDVLYMRIPYPSFLMSYTLKSPRTCKIVIEYQDIEPLEYRSKGIYWYSILDLLYGDAIRRYSDAIVGVTEEITKYQLIRSGNPLKPHITIGNGIDVTSIKIRTCPPMQVGNELHLICVANVNTWHGLDRLLRGLADYDGPTTVIFHIAGGGSELENLKGLTSDLGIGDRVVFHGYLTGELLDELYNKCHIGVGSMAVHRKGLVQTSELKIREYCARGIPFIMAAADPDFEYEDFPYIKKFPADDTPIDVDEIITFAEKVFSDPEHPLKLRQYATEHLNWSVKMLQLSEFLNMLMNSKK